MISSLFEWYLNYTRALLVTQNIKLRQFRSLAQMFRRIINVKTNPANFLDKSKILDIKLARSGDIFKSVLS